MSVGELYLDTDPATAVMSAAAWGCVVHYAFGYDGGTAVGVELVSQRAVNAVTVAVLFYGASYVSIFASDIEASVLSSCFDND